MDEPSPSPSPAGADSRGVAETGIGSVDGSEPVAGTDITVGWSRRGDQLEFEIVTKHPGDAAPERIAGVVEIAERLVAAAHRTGADLTMAAAHPADSWRALPEAVAARLDMEPTRLLLQLRRPLPVEPDHPARRGPSIRVRPIRPEDDDAWIRVNNRAFADHPDQGRETPETLTARRAGDWYDPAGFLVADDPSRPGELAGFCWTKVHPETDREPALGEIYVIGVDPSRSGEGLGAALVLAGLDHLADRGVTVSNLYVEADNAPALRLYDRLGYEVHERRRVYAPRPERSQP